MLEDKIEDAICDIEDELNLLVPYMGFDPSNKYENPKLFIREGHHKDSEARCQCCLNDFGVEVKSYLTEMGVDEQYEFCHICGISYQFVYGTTVLSFEDIEWRWAYNISDRERNVLNMEIHIVQDIYKRMAQEEEVSEVEEHFLLLLKDRSILEYKMEEGGYYA